MGQDKPKLESPDFTPGRYTHSKTGNTYWAYGLTYHTEDEEWLVEYMADSGPNRHIRFSRPLKMWAENITVDGRLVPRFKLWIYQGVEVQSQHV
jgi:hypothetical protein